MQLLYLGSVIHEHADLIVETKRRARFMRACYKRLGSELYDMTTAPLRLKARTLQTEVIETLLFGCVTWTLTATHYDEPRKALLEVLRRVLDFQPRADHTNLSCAKALKMTKRESIETSIRKLRLFFAGAMVW